MQQAEKTNISIQTRVKAPLMAAWNVFIQPDHIMKWNFASPEWHTTKAENDVRVGGRIMSRMEAKDGSAGFDFSGQYTRVEEYKLLEYRLDDGRMVLVQFHQDGDATVVSEDFEAEGTHGVEMQKAGWQAILDNYKNYTEGLNKPVKQRFDIEINAPAEKVFTTMLDDSGYRQWTSAFNPTSHYKGKWEKGAKILFIGTDAEGTEGGMVSRIKDIIPNEFVSIEHLGILNNGNEITSGAEVEGWAGALENYRFVPVGNATRVEVEMDSNAAFEDYFNQTWPKALQKLKEISEN